ncbi:MAG: alpha/beta hydrolase [Phycisphaeraceae bacterium]|nr:alpha/beta hydrolase [Phycisphaeraceae bacterium]
MDVIGLLMLLACGLGVFAAAVIAFTLRTLTRPPRRTYSWAVARGVPGEPPEVRVPWGRVEYSSWSFASRGRDLPVWDIRGARADGPTAVLTHGWGDSRVIALSRLPALLACCARVVMWDLPGHGDAPGTCTLGTRECDDLVALLERLGPAEPVVLYGSSLGAGVSIVVAARDAARLGVVGVIAEAPYRVPRLPAQRVLRMLGLPWRWNLPIVMALVGSRQGYGVSWVASPAAGGFDRAVHAANMPVPLLVLHGTDDEVCPIEDGRAIAAAAPAGRIVEVEGASHNNLWTDDRFIPVCAAAVAEFVAALKSAQKKAAGAAPAA